MCVCNAAHMRNVPGRKRDVMDCQWIAELHEYGLLRPSFIPAGAVAELRAWTRYRKKLIEQRTSEGQRLAKVLEDAGWPVACRACGADLSGAAVTGGHKRQVFEAQPAPPPVVTEYRVVTKARPGCGAVTEGESPEGVTSLVQYGPGVHARAALAVCAH